MPTHAPIPERGARARARPERAYEPRTSVRAPNVAVCRPPRNNFIKYESSTHTPSRRARGRGPPSSQLVLRLARVLALPVLARPRVLERLPLASLERRSEDARLLPRVLGVERESAEGIQLSALRSSVSFPTPSAPIATPRSVPFIVTRHVSRRPGTASSGRRNTGVPAGARALVASHPRRRTYVPSTWYWGTCQDGRVENFAPSGRSRQSASAKPSNAPCVSVMPSSSASTPG